MLQVLNLLKINATNGKENFCEISEKELKTLKELARREDKEKQVLQQQINKAIEILGKYKHYYSPEPEQNSKNEDIVMKTLSILQMKE